jgi:anti-anti-sigma factor
VEEKMDANHLEVVATESPDGARLELVGRMDFASVAKFRSAMIKASQKEWSNVVVDCARLEYIDSSAMGNLLFWRGKLEEHQRAISLANCNGPVLKALKVGGFHKLFEMQ